MGAVFFYHLTASPLEATLPALLDKSRGAGWRVLLRGTDAKRLEWLDEKLWLAGGQDSFVPHGVAGGDHDELQPILLTTGADNANNAQCIMCFDGAEILPDEVKASERACVLFDGNDPVAVDAARAQWKHLTQAACAAQYWAQEDGRWIKKFETD